MGKGGHAIRGEGGSGKRKKRPDFIAVEAPSPSLMGGHRKKARGKRGY